MNTGSRLGLIGLFFATMIPFFVSLGYIDSYRDVVPILVAAVSGVGWAIVIFQVVRDLSTDDEAAHAVAASPTPVAAALVTRWVERSHFYRFAGGLIGWLSVWILPAEGFWPTVYGVLAGLTAGGAFAELHVFRGKGGNSNTVVADLTPRHVADYRDQIDMMVMRLIVVCGIALNLIGSTFGNVLPVHAAKWSLIAVAIVLATMVLQRRVATRSRPALTEQVREADDLLRFLASTQGFVRPAIALALFSFGNALTAYERYPFPALQFMVVAAGITWWYRGRPRRIPELIEQANAA